MDDDSGFAMRQEFVVHLRPSARFSIETPPWPKSVSLTKREQRARQMAHARRSR